MPLIEQLDLGLTEEELWRIQGRRLDQVRPMLRELMRDALAEGLPLLEPRLAYEMVEVEQAGADTLVLRGGATLHSPTLAQQMAPAERVAVAACTVGSRLDARIAELADSDAVMAAGLDSVGTVAVDALSAELCRLIGEEARRAGWRSGVPFSPGEGDWPLADQRTVLGLLPAGRLGIALRADHLMTPMKSLSLVIGMGKEMRRNGAACEDCSASARCRYAGEAE